MSEDDVASVNARLYGLLARLWDHYWKDGRGIRPSFVRYAAGTKTKAILVAVPMRLEDLLPFVAWVNERDDEVGVRVETGDLPAVRWWGEWTALRVVPAAARWRMIGMSDA